MFERLGGGLLAQRCDPCVARDAMRYQERKQRRTVTEPAVHEGDPLPRKRGYRVLVSPRVFRKRYGSRYLDAVRVRCQFVRPNGRHCTKEQIVRLSDWKIGNIGEACRSCAASIRATERYSKERASKPRTRCARTARMVEFATKPYWADIKTRALVAQNPEGMTLQQIAIELGCTRERVRQIEAIAVRKLRKSCQKAGLRLEDFDREKLRVLLDSDCWPTRTQNRRAA